MSFRKIKNAFRRFTCSVIAATMCLGAGIIYAPAGYALTADEIRAQIQQCKDNIAYYENQINAMQGDINENQEALNSIKSKLDEQKSLMDYYNNLVHYKNDDISEIEKQIAEKRNEISETEAAIALKESDITKLSEDNKENLEKFAVMVRTLYVSGNDDIFEILSGSASFYDFMVRTEIVNNMSEKNLEFMNNLLKDIEKLNSDIKILETDKENLNKKIDELNIKIGELEEERDELQEFVDEASAATSKYESEYTKYYDSLSELLDKESDLEHLKEANQNEADNFEAQLQEIIRKNQETQQNPVVNSNGWMWPLPGRNRITTWFGYDGWLDRIHKGLDIGDAGIQGDHILASRGGTVIIADHDYIPGYSYGKYVVIDHGDGYTTTYAHMQTVYANVGDVVEQGQALGEVGNTGYSFGYHLHFEVRLWGTPMNPTDYVTIP